MITLETRTSSRGHSYTVAHGPVTSVSIFQTTGTIKCRWPFTGGPPPWEKQEHKVFGPNSMETAMRFAETIAKGEPWTGNFT